MAQSPEQRTREERYLTAPIDERGYIDMRDNPLNEIRPPDIKDFPGQQYWADSFAWEAYQQARRLRKKGAACVPTPGTMPCHLIEIAFDDLDERDRAFEAIEKLLGEMGQIGTLSARTESADAK